MHNTPKDRRPIAISGPSGVGKGTLIQKLLASYPDAFASTVSHTTREARQGETEGQAYFFVSETDFQLLVAQDAFIESALFSGNFYGTSKKTVFHQTDKGVVVILDIDMQGVRAVKADSALDARCVFVRPPTFEALENRLRERRTETEEQIQGRLARAKAELETAEKSGLFDVFIINDDLEKAFQELVDFIFGPGSSQSSAST